MNKREKRELCKLYDTLHDQINSIGHVLPFPVHKPTIEQYEKIVNNVNILRGQLKDTAHEIMDNFDIKEVYYDEFIDEHCGCYSYPNCDLAPLGCCVEHGIDGAEPYGHR